MGGQLLQVQRKRFTVQVGVRDQFRESSPQLSPDNALPAPDDQGLNARADQGEQIFGLAGMAAKRGVKKPGRRCRTSKALRSLAIFGHGAIRVRPISRQVAHKGRGARGDAGRKRMLWLQSRRTMRRHQGRTKSGRVLELGTHTPKRCLGGWEMNVPCGWKKRRGGRVAMGQILCGNTEG